DQLFVVYSGDWASGNIAGDVAAGTSRSQSDALQTLDQVWNILDSDPVELNVLARGNVGDAAAVLFGQSRNFTHLIAAQQPIRNANAHHKKLRGVPFSIFSPDNTESVALRVNSPRTKIRAGPFRWN